MRACGRHRGASPPKAEDKSSLFASLTRRRGFPASLPICSPTSWLEKSPSSQDGGGGAGALGWAPGSLCLSVPYPPHADVHGELQNAGSYSLPANSQRLLTRLPGVLSSGVGHLCPASGPCKAILRAQWPDCVLDTGLEHDSHVKPSTRINTQMTPLSSQMAVMHFHSLLPLHLGFPAWHVVGVQHTPAPPILWARSPRERTQLV